MSLANFIKTAATQPDEVATEVYFWRDLIVWSHNSCQLHLLGGGLSYLLPFCLPFIFRLFASLCDSVRVFATLCLSTSASALVINQLVASLTSYRLIFFPSAAVCCKLTSTHTHPNTHFHIAGASSCQWLGLSLVSCAIFSTHHFLR